MANRLAILAIAATFAAATMTAHAAGMPDSGTKNFVPGGDAPSYLTNENLSVAPGSAGQSPLGTAYNEPAGAEQDIAPPHAAETRTQQHGRTSAGHRSSYRAAANAELKTRSRRLARSRTERVGRSASLGYNRRPTRAENRRVSAARPAIPRHGKANARHAAVKSAARRG